MLTISCRGVLSSYIQDNRETANKAVREWKNHHQQAYSDFKRQVAAIGSGDLSLMERTIGFLDDCMPQNAKEFLRVHI